MGSSAHESKLWLEKCDGYLPEELSMPGESMTCFFEETERRVCRKRIRFAAYSTLQ